MKNVLIPTKLDKFAADLLKEKGFKVVQAHDKTIEELAAANPETEALIIRSEKVTPAVMDALPKLKLVVRAGAGYDNVDIKYARRKNVDVMNTPGANANAVAEEVVAMMLAAYRKLIPADISTRNGEWEKNKFMGNEITEKTIGIIGLGNIGRLLVKRLQGFEMKFLAYDPVISADFAEKMGVELCTVEDIFKRADIISLHLPENEATRGLVNKKLLETMKTGAMLVNCARSGIINENDLREMKPVKKLIFCNDVYAKDAAGPKSVADIADVMAPHLGASTAEANFVAAKRAAEQTIAYFEKGVTNCVVNKGVPDGLDEKYQTLAFTIARLARTYLGEKKAPHKIETSYYGKLRKFGNWMLAPVTAGISPEFDPFLDASDALSFLKERGIEVSDREVDDSKNYGEAITVDLFEGDKTIRKVSIRGTITENHMMVSRINNYDKLYLEPSGHNLFVEYGDEPGVIGKIASILGAEGINIIDIRAPQDLKANMSLAAIKVNKELSAEALDKIKASVNAKKIFQFTYEA